MNNGIYIRKTDVDYDRFGLTTEIEKWEDGQRTNGDKDSFEWWYFDAEYENGTKIVVIFYTKDRFDVKGKSLPTATIDITFPNGSTIYQVVRGDIKENSHYSTEKCDVVINKCSCVCEDNEYKVTFVADSLEYECVMSPVTNNWRPHTGYFHFDNNTDDYFAWLVPVPRATVKATLSIHSNNISLSGAGYHDHNWGNFRLDKHIKEWHWFRTQIGQYTIVAFDIKTKNKLQEDSTIMCVFKDVELTNNDDYDTEVKMDDYLIHNRTGKPISNRITLSKYIDGNNFSIEFIRDHDLAVYNLLEAMGFSYLSKLYRRYIRRLPTYIRTVGEATLTIKKSDVTIYYYGEALWEQMKF